MTALLARLKALLGARRSPVRPEPSTFEIVRDELLALTRELRSVPPEPGPRPFRRLDPLLEESLPRVIALGERSPEALLWVAGRNQWADPKATDLYPGGEVWDLLLRAMERVNPHLLVELAVRRGDAFPFARSLAVQALLKRGEVRLLEEILTLIGDESAPVGVRAEAVKAVARARLPGVLPVIRAARASVRPAEGELESALLWALGELDDVAAFHEMVERGGAIWNHSVTTFVMRSGGVAGVLDAVYGPAPGVAMAERLERVVRTEPSGPVRVWALRQLQTAALTGSHVVEPERLVPLLLHLLGADHWALSWEAASLLHSYPRLEPPVGSGPAPSAERALRAIASDAGASEQRRLWAVFALRLMDLDATRELEAFPEPRVLLREAVPHRVRAAILRGSALEAVMPGTDVRWLIEMCDLGGRSVSWEEDDAFPERCATLLAALRGEGLACGQVRFADAPVGGSQTYMVSNYALLSVEGHAIRICESAPVVSAERPLPPQLEVSVRRGVAAAGLIWLEPMALEAPLSGLVLQHYGEVREWTVGEYLHVLTDAER